MPSSEARLDRLLFAEGGARVLISCSENQSIKLKNYYKQISLEQSNTFALSHLGQVNNQNNLSIYQSDNLILDVNILNLKDTYKNAIYKKISK